MSTTTFFHGVSWSDVPTSIVAPIEATSGLNVVVGCAPIHLAAQPAPINRPRLYRTYAAAVREMGFTLDFARFNIAEHIDAAFVQFGIFPCVYINVFDPARHRRANQTADIVVSDGSAVIEQVGLIPNSLRLALDEEDLEPIIDFVAVHNQSTGHVEIAFMTDVEEGAELTATFDVVDTSLVTRTDIIGGVDMATGKPTGLECIEEVFPLFGLVPGVILCPGFSGDPEVASVMVAKCELINGCFSARCAIDVNTALVTDPNDVPNHKRRNNFVFARQDVLFPMIQLGTRNYHLSSQWGPLQMHTDATRGNNIPFFSPSNKNLRMTGTVIAGARPGDAPQELTIDFRDANYLNSQGISTALNTSGGWKGYGNRTAIYPSDSDPKDMWIPVRRMFDFVGNSVVLTTQRYVDEPGNRRKIDSVVNTVNNWLNGFVGVGALLGALCEFRDAENPTTQLLNGHYVYWLSLCPPIPAEWIQFKLEFDVSYLATLFA